MYIKQRHCLFRANKSSKKISLGKRKDHERPGAETEVDMRRSDCACVCVYVRPYVCNGVTKGWKGRWLLRKDDFSSCRTYRSPPRPYTGPIPILGKSTLGIENGDESADGRRESELQEVGGQRVAVARPCTREQRNGRKNRGAVFTKGHVAQARLFSSFFF